MRPTVVVAGRQEGGFDVEVRDAGTVTRHVVVVPPGLAAELGCPGVADDVLVKTSFEFLLQREPATSILRSFGLDVIEGYFRDYRREMARRLA